MKLELENGKREAKQRYIKTKSKNVRVDAQVETHQLVKRRIVVTQHAAKVARVIQTGILVDNAVFKDVAVYNGRDFGQHGRRRENVFQDVIVVLGFGHARGVGLGEFGFRLTGRQANGELRHGMHVFGQAHEQGFDVGWEFRARVQFRRQRVDLFFGGHFAGQEQPHETFQQRFSVPCGSFEGGKHRLTFRNGQAAEANALVRVQVGCFPKHAFDTASATDALIDIDFSDAVIYYIVFD